jgi:type I restriction enzyme S subunit
VPFREIAWSLAERVDDPGASGLHHYVGLEHLDPDTPKISRWGTPSDVEATKLRFYPGDVIYARRRAYQRKLGVAEWDGIASAHALVLRARPDVCLPGYLPYFLMSEQFHQRALDISVGSLSPTINWKTLETQQFVVPPLSAQEVQLPVLLEIERVLDAYRRASSAIDLLRASAFREAGTRGVRQPLADLIDAVEAGKSPSAVDRKPEAGELGVLKVSAIRDGWFDPDEVKTLAPGTAMPSSAIVQDGDLLVSRANTSERVGWACIVEGAAPGTYLCDKTWRLSVKPSLVRPRVLMALLGLEDARRQIEASATGSSASMKNISQPKLLSIELDVPTPSDQELLMALDSRLSAASSQLATATAAVRGLRSSLINAPHPEG